MYLLKVVLVKASSLKAAGGGAHRKARPAALRVKRAAAGDGDAPEDELRVSVSTGTLDIFSSFLSHYSLKHLFCRCLKHLKCCWELVVFYSHLRFGLTSC